MSYGFSVERAALARLLAAPTPRRWRLFDLFSSMANQPFAPADLTLRNSDGSTIEVRVFGDILVHYHVDHAVKTVLILDYEEVTAD